MSIFLYFFFNMAAHHCPVAFAPQLLHDQAHQGANGGAPLERTRSALPATTALTAFSTSSSDAPDRPAASPPHLPSSADARPRARSRSARLPWPRFQGDQSEAVPVMLLCQTGDLHPLPGQLNGNGLNSGRRWKQKQICFQNISKERIAGGSAHNTPCSQIRPYWRTKRSDRICESSASSGRPASPA